MKKVVFVLGIVITVAAWFVDHAQTFPVLLKRIAPGYVAMQEAFEILDRGEKEVVSVSHEGAILLMDIWKPAPPANARSLVTGIGRSAGIFNIISGKHRYELRLLVQDNKLKLNDFIWDDLEAKELMRKGLDSRLDGWSFGMLCFGVLLTVVGYI